MFYVLHTEQGLELSEFASDNWGRLEPRQLGRCTMRRTIRTIVILIATAAFASGQDTGRQIYASHSSSVLLLYAQSNGEFIAQGTGFLIAGPKIVTNAHVADSGKIFIDLGAVRIPTHVEKTDNLNDLAILTVDAEITAPPLPLADSTPAPGDKVFVIGNPKGLEKTISEGVVSAIRNTDGKQLLQITAPISHGSSGSPVFNDRGQVIGVAVGVIPGGENLNFAVPVVKLRELLAGGPATAASAAALLDEVESVEAQQREDTYSQSSDSPYQLKQNRINELLQQALDAAGSNPSVLVRLSQIALNNDVDVAIVAADRATKMKRSSPAELALARALNTKGYWDQGDDRTLLLARAEEAAHSALAEAKSPTAELYYTLGDIQENRGNYSDANRNFAKSLELNQKTGDAEGELSSLRSLFRCADEQGDNQAEQKWFSLLQASGKASWWDWESHAQHLRKQQRWVDAGAAYLHAANAGGPYYEWCNGALMYAGENQDDVVLSAARTCIDKGSGVKNQDAQFALAHREIANVLYDRGVYSEALAHAREATALDPSDAWGFEVLSRTLNQLHRNLEAVKSATEAIRLSDGKYASMHFALGAAEFDLENWDLARQSFQKAAELSPKDDASAYNIGLCFQRQGYFIDAAHWYEEVLRRNPNRSDRQELLQRIDTLRR